MVAALWGCTGAPTVNPLVDASPAMDAAASDASDDTPTPALPWRSRAYPETWTPPRADDGDVLPDYSYAGYRYGEALPRVQGPVRSVVDEGADPGGTRDSTPAFVRALAALPDTGGVVFVPAGTYRLDDDLRITRSRVVLRGEGSTSRLVFTRRQSTQGANHLTFAGAGREGPMLPLAEDAAQHATSIVLAPGDGPRPAVGDAVVVGWFITDAFTAEHAMTGVWRAFENQWQSVFRRTVTAVTTQADGRVTVGLDVPLRYRVQVRDRAALRVEEGALREVGLEDLALSNTLADWAAARSESQVHLVAFDRVRDGWMRGVTSFVQPGLAADPERPEVRSSGVIVRASARVTVADCRLGRAQHRGVGGNGYLYEIMASNEVLVRDSVAEGGRHNFIQNWGFGTAGCVWLRVHSRGGVAENGAFRVTGLSEMHHSLAMGNLIDESTVDDGWSIVNRGDESSGAGLTGTATTWWNTRGTGLLRAYNAGPGWVLGTAPTVRVESSLTTVVGQIVGAHTAPEDTVEGLGAGAMLQPASLYEDQRRRRLARGP